MENQPKTVGTIIKKINLSYNLIFLIKKINGLSFLLTYDIIW